MNGPSTISFPLNDGLFNFRTAGVVVHNGKLLLHKEAGDNFWSLPGGRVDMFEETHETLLREMIEETGMQAGINRLIWVAENFFMYNGKRYHEIGFYYEMSLLNVESQEDFPGVEIGTDLTFHWHDLKDLQNIKIYPEFISREITIKTENTRHFVAGYKDLDAG